MLVVQIPIPSAPDPRSHGSSVFMNFHACAANSTSEYQESLALAHLPQPPL